MNGATIYVCLLQACRNAKSLGKGRLVHGHMIKTGLQADTFLLNNLMSMYVRCASLADACQVFDKISQPNLVSWTSMISGYAQHGFSEEALKLYCLMLCSGVRPNQFTFGSVLRACAGKESLEQGKQVHAHTIKSEFESNVFVGTSLLDMYAKSNGVLDARQVFDKMSHRNAISWTSIIAVYAQNGQGEDALKLFSDMRLADSKPDQFTFASVFRACASIAALEPGMQIHSHFIKTGIESDLCVENALVSMYCKCGSMGAARHVFDKMAQRDTVSWSTLIAGYAQHGAGEDALKLYLQMRRASVKANHITFVGVLSACSHVGLLEEGRYHFDSMSRDHGIVPQVEHYACVVDLLGRAGRLVEAEDFIRKMPLKPGPVVWRTFLAACRIHGDVELAKHAAECILELEPEDAGTYVLLSNIYAAAGRWDYVDNVRKVMKDKGVRKEPGCSWIEVQNRVHAFVVGDASHPQMEEIYAMLEKLNGQMREAGYVPEKKAVLYDVGEEQKEHSLCLHSEKLAVAFGLISRPSGIPIRVIKNLRVCGDCHTAIKFISKIAGREIVLRDAYRFHHFKDEHCSCGDYW